jgi:D-3-phosphoglycerate dehydrogenase
MFDISIFNKLSEKGLERFDERSYCLSKEALSSCNGIVLRSYNLNSVDFPKSLLGIARAGAGYNNIPVEPCTQSGIVVFNTPGANANSVMELTLLALLLSSRQVYPGMRWAQELTGSVAADVEKGKSKFAGPEIYGKTLAVIGLGAIGVKVANVGIKMGMKVIGYDPYMSFKRALGLSWDVDYADSLDAVFSKADYVSLHIPLMDKTKGFMGAENIANMKPGSRLINMSRGGLVDTESVISALESGHISAYATDFPDEKLLNCDKALCIPHLGASTPESEENCAVMAVDQLKDFLENGNIVNSVNFPTCTMERTNGRKRLTIMNNNVPNMIGSFTHVLAKHKINIGDMINKSSGAYAYNIIDVETEVTPEVLSELQTIEGIIRVRLID